ncbi:hypothetical protein SAY86_009980 [Trapa natans]|uniref:Uncharacterized protein n=1 Tax=Trapa natans TaxID=22666 RepID=A0AAN7L4W1_TRANT|nr:hypothetical protein SAY86_009980 [Trapa natans]
MDPSQLFLAGEENNFGFELFPFEHGDLAISEWELRFVPPKAANVSLIPDRCLYGAGDAVLSADQLMLAMAGFYDQLRSQVYSEYADAGDFYEEEEEDVGEDDDGLDDELVPRHLSGKLGRQRIRKLGKRFFSRMYSSKRSPYLYMKPGCLYGKHGLGLKHCIC